MSKKEAIYGILVIALILITASTAMAVAIPGQSTTPSKSLPYNLQQVTNLTPSDTIVIAVANPDDYKVLAIADEVADHIGSTVLVTPDDKVSIYVIETLTQMLAYGNVTKAIVIGTSPNTTTIAGIIGDITDPLSKKNIQISNIIYSPTPEGLSQRAALYMWDSASTIIVADGYVHNDLAKALLLSVKYDVPILYEQLGYDTINSTAQILGTTTIYITPAVDPDTQTLMSGNFTVNSSPGGYDLTKSVENLTVDILPTTKKAVFVVVKESDITPYDPLFHLIGDINSANATMILAENSTSLGTNQSSYLTTLSPNMTILVGDLSVISDTLATDIALNTGKTPWRMIYGNDIEKITELSMIASGYFYPVVITTYEQNNNTFTYTFKNIGFTDVIKYADYSLRVEFTKSAGTFTDSTPTETFQNDTSVVYVFTDPIYPSNSATLTFTASGGANFTLIPSLDYNAYTLAGTVKPMRSFLDYLISYFSGAQSWILEQWNNVVGVFTTVLPVPSYIATVIAAVITFIILWAIVGIIAYVIVVYGMKRTVTNTMWYGPIVWIIRR